MCKLFGHIHKIFFFTLSLRYIDDLVIFGGFLKGWGHKFSCLLVAYEMEMESPLCTNEQSGAFVDIRLMIKGTSLNLKQKSPHSATLPNIVDPDEPRGL